MTGKTIKFHFPPQRKMVDEMVKKGLLKTTKTGKVRKFKTEQTGMYKNYRHPHDD